ncbi:hypothetical protein EVAR_11198_1 [Eumeta japonica]|uniref:Uncharacterized protein n=1 Tax=Eumeta variegata TaxID=151549 RepID=A0A4C1U4W9_EUMVA|nr:hypothetical protein EVAR_11198_1 [Eumeta japonica]
MAVPVSGADVSVSRRAAGAGARLRNRGPSPPAPRRGGAPVAWGRIGNLLKNRLFSQCGPGTRFYGFYDVLTGNMGNASFARFKKQRVAISS